MSLTFKCACGKTHTRFAKTQVVSINGNKWDLDCYLEKMNIEYKNIQAETMITQLVLAEIKTKHPEVNVEDIAKDVARRLNESFNNEGGL